MNTVESPSHIDAKLAEGQRPPRIAVLLHDVSWQTYEALRSQESNNHLRMTYDRGELEIMSPLRRHGKIATLLGLMIYEWTRLKRIEIESAGDLTCSRQDVAKGLEPDLSYWITHQADVFGRDDYDPQTDPPPDLVLEVDNTRKSISKLPIYQALKVPEIWRWQKGLEVLRLSQDGIYVSKPDSVELPGFPVKLAQELIEQRRVKGEMALMEEFVAAIAILPNS